MVNTVRTKRIRGGQRKLGRAECIRGGQRKLGRAAAAEHMGVLRGLTRGTLAFRGTAETGLTFLQSSSLQQVMNTLCSPAMAQQVKVLAAKPNAVPKTHLVGKNWPLLSTVHCGKHTST